MSLTGKYDETVLSPMSSARIMEVLSEVSSTRWPIAVALVEFEDGRTATQLAKDVGKSVSWTLKQAKQMAEDKILTAVDDPLNQPRGRVYALADGVKEVLKQSKQYEATSRKLRLGEKSANLASAAPTLATRVGQIVGDGLEAMAHDADVAAIGYGFIPVSVVRIGTGDEAQYRHVSLDNKPMMVADAFGFRKFVEIMRQVRQLDPSGESTPTLQTLSQANPSE